MGSGIKRADLAFIYTSGVSLSSLASHEEEKRSEAWVEKAESEHARRSQFLGIDCARASEQQLRARAVRPRATRRHGTRLRPSACPCAGRLRTLGS